MTKILTKDRAKAGMLALSEVAVEVRDEIANTTGMAQSIALATGLVAINDAFTDDTMAVLLTLQGTDIGFKCDKEYPAEIIKQAAIRALMQGAYLHGNEFNVIAGQCYLTQAFFIRRLKEYPGLSNLIIDVDSPSDGVAKGKQVQLRVGGYAAAKVDGHLVEVFCRKNDRFGDQRLTVVAYDGDIDQAMGKAKKRIAQKLYERISGVTLSDDSEGATVTVVDPQRIAGEERQEHPPEEQQQHQDSESQVDPYEPFRDEFRNASKVAKSISAKIVKTSDSASLDSVMAEADAAKKDGMSQQDFDRLFRLANFHLQQLAD